MQSVRAKKLAAGGWRNSPILLNGDRNMLDRVLNIALSVSDVIALVALVIYWLN